MNISVCKTRSHLERGVFFVHLWTKGVWGESPASTFLHSFAEQKGVEKEQTCTSLHCLPC